MGERRARPASPIDNFQPGDSSVIPSELVREFESQMRDLKVGHTPMRRAQKLEKKLGLRRLHLKLESENPSGTHKDRMALLLALDARRKGMKCLAAVTCGNYGVALAYICNKLDMECRIFVPSEFAATRNRTIEDMGGKVVVAPGDYEAALRACEKEAYSNSWYNANAGGANKEAAVYSYTFISKEIAQDLGRQPDWVCVPFGNGTVIAGVWHGFQGMRMKPKMLAYSNNNSAVRGLVLKSRDPVDVPDLRITPINEPLSGNFLLDFRDGMDAVLESNGAAFEIDDNELMNTAEMIYEEEGLDILPASAGAVSAATRLESKNHMLVAVITGRDHSRE